MEAITSKPGLFDDLVEELPPAVSDQTFLEAQARLAQAVASGARKLPRRKAPARTPQQKRQSFLKGEATRIRNLRTARACWIADHPTEYAWLEAKRWKVGFAAALWTSLDQWGRLTEGQIGAVRRCLDQDEARRAAQVAGVVVVAGVGLSALVDAFKHAREQGLKAVKVRLPGGLVVSHAPPGGANPGALYVKADGEYMGKITVEGRFQAVYTCTDTTKEVVARAMVNPLEQAKLYGQQTGSCSVCGRELTDPESIAAGIGPICAGRMGW